MAGCRFALVRACLVFVLSAVSLSAAAATAHAAAAQKQGYIPMADGTQLQYTVDLPDADGRFPVVMVYDGYCEGAGALKCNDAVNAKKLFDAGYAVLGVSIRGTSCSTGTFDAFTDQEWRDGAAAVEWAAQQPWSTGRLGMIGDSFPGITQLGVAGLRPPHLDAIAPFQVITDLYRDVGYPGGISNVGFGAFWAGFNQPNNSYGSGANHAVAVGDTGCALALAEHAAAEPTQNIGLQALQHPYFNDFWRGRQPGANAAKIDIPTFGCQTWQDDQTSSRATSWLEQLDPKRTWLVASNGYHAQCVLGSPRISAQLVRFFDRYVKGERNGFEKDTPHIQLWHDTAVNAANENTPAWVTNHKSFKSIPVKPLKLYFQADRSLALTRPKQASETPDSYAYPGPNLGTENGIVGGQNGVAWKGQEPPGASLAYTTPALSRDAEFYGSGSADIWMSSTAPDTDLQITLTEVRPDGQEVYVSRGWLRASHRTLDRARSTTLTPHHTNTQADNRPLEPGEPTLMRVQLWPLNYVFRKGSSIRLWINAPTGMTGGWSLDFIKTPATNSIFTDRERPTALVLGHLRGGKAGAPLPECGTLLNQPCRPNQTPVPPKTMTIR